MKLPEPYQFHWGPMLHQAWHGMVFWYVKLVDVVVILWIIAAGALGAGHRWWYDYEEEVDDDADARW